MGKTIVFVHGTGVREPALGRTVDVLRKHAAEFLPGWHIEPCAWGDPFGAALNRHGKSIPSYQRSGDTSGSEAAQTRARWALLAEDPLLELRVAPTETSWNGAPGPRIWQRMLQAHQHASFAPMLQTDAERHAQWLAFRDSIIADAQWSVVVTSLSLSEQSASPVVARALAAAFQRWLRARSLPPLEGKDRDAWVAALIPALGGPPADIKDWFLARLTAYTRDRRGSMADLTSPGVGDVLRYQARGETVRKFLADTVQRCEATVLLAHSLGGIAAVDWLVLERTGIETLITVGSQAAFFYEIDALPSLVLGTSLPPHFPKRWLNIVDPNDFLSYPAAGIFTGQVLDVTVDNGEAFPESHGAYFRNRDEVWPVISDFVQGR